MEKKYLSLMLLVSVSSAFAMDDANGDSQDQFVNQDVDQNSDQTDQVAQDMSSSDAQVGDQADESTMVQSDVQDDNQAMQDVVQPEACYATQIEEAQPVQALNLNDFSQQFVNQCPALVSQDSWNNYLLQLQMHSDLALTTNMKTKEACEAMLTTLAANCNAEQQILLNSLAPVDAESFDAVKDKINSVCEQYIKQVSDSVVSDLVDDGATQEVKDIISDLNVENDAQ